MKTLTLILMTLMVTQAFATAIDGTYKLESTACSSGKEISYNIPIQHQTGIVIARLVEWKMTLKDGKGSSTVTFNTAGTITTGTQAFDYIINGTTITVIEPQNEKTIVSQGYYTLSGSKLVLVTKSASTETLCSTNDSLVTIYNSAN